MTDFAARPRGRPPKPAGTHNVQIRGSLSPEALALLLYHLDRCDLGECREEIERLLRRPPKRGA